MPITRRSRLRPPITTQIDPTNALRRARAIPRSPIVTTEKLALIVVSGTRCQTVNAGWPVKIETANCANNGDLPTQAS